MHGIVNRSIQEFVRSTYGERAWRDACRNAQIDERGFHLARTYPDESTLELFSIAGAPLGKTAHEMVEDLGIWLASRPALARLLRFGGSDFSQFLLSLPELPGRLRMVVPGLDLPPVTVTQDGQSYCVSAPGAAGMWERAIAGMLHAMADAYGALAIIDYVEGGLRVEVPLAEFAEARPFSLSTEGGA